MTVRGIIAGVVCSLLAMGMSLAYRAEAEGKASEEVSLKIGYVDMGEVIDRYPKAKDAGEVLRKEEEAKRKELEEKGEEINKLEKELKAQESLLKEEEKEKRVRIIKEKWGRLRQLSQKYNLEMRNKFIKKQEEVLEELNKVVESFGKEKGYTLILDARQVIYGLEGLDVTEEIIKRLNKK